MAKKKKKKKSSDENGVDVLFKIDKDEGNRLICLRNEYKGTEYLNIRMQYFDDEEEEWKMTKKGITLTFKNGFAEDFMKKCRKAFRIKKD